MAKNIREEMKVTLSEINKNLQGTNSGEDEADNQINDLKHKEGKAFNQNNGKEKRILKNEDKLRNLWDNFKCINNQITGMPEEEEEQEIENLFE